MQHVDEGTLQAWLDGEAVGSTVEAHLEACPECAGRAEELRALGRRTRMILGEGVPTSAQPDFAAVRRRAEHLRHATPPRRRWKAPAWAASVVLAVGVGWMAREIASPDAGPPLAGPEAAPLPVEPDAASRVVEPEAETMEVEPQAAPTRVESDPRSPASADVPVPAAEARAAGREATPPPPAPDRAEVADARPPLPRPEAPRTDRPGAARIASGVEPGVVRGRVTSGEGAGVAGAQVYVPGTNLGALSDADGSFVLPLTEAGLGDSVLIEVARIGYRVESRRVGLDAEAAPALEIRLTEQALALEQVVVTGAAPSVTPEASIDASELEWSELPVAEAERRLGFSLLAPDGSPPDSVAVGVSPGVPEAESTPRVARFTVPVGAGGAVTLYQSPGPVGLSEALPEGHATSARRIGGLWVRATGPVGTETLDALLARLR